MHGSSFQFEQAIHSKQEQLRQINSTNENTFPPKKIVMPMVITFLIAISSVALAGPKEPKLAGGNGNVRGR